MKKDYIFRNATELKEFLIDNKKDYFEEKIHPDYIFGGAGKKSVKLCSTHGKEDVFVYYEDIFKVETPEQEALFKFFVTGEKNTE